MQPVSGTVTSIAYYCLQPELTYTEKPREDRRKDIGENASRYLATYFKRPTNDSTLPGLSDLSMLVRWSRLKLHLQIVNILIRGSGLSQLTYQPVHVTNDIRKVI